MRWRGSTLADALARPANGFTPVRLLLALAVVVSHGFSITTGRIEDEPLFRLTGFTLGEHAVNGFFAVSGLLVTMSFWRRSLRDYLLARLLRILPALAVAALAVAILLGPALTTRSLAIYLGDPETWRFVAETLRFKSNGRLPGVFDDNPFRTPIPTVWTLRYEVLFYAGLVVCGVLGLRRVRMAAPILAGGLFVALIAIETAWPDASKATRTTFRLAFLFAAGGSLYLWRDRVPLSAAGAGALALLAVATARLPVYPAVLFAAEAYGVIWLSLSPGLVQFGDWRNDLSYGVYLYGWPIQQAFRQLLPGAGSVELLVPALFVTLVVAFASWRLVEKPALALKFRSVGPIRFRTAEPGGS